MVRYWALRINIPTMVLLTRWVNFPATRPVNTNTPNVLYVKMLKNTILKTNEPIWNLMMKNIYPLGAYQISSTNFHMSITRLDNTSGIAGPVMTQGQNTTGKLWLQLLGLDNLDQQNQLHPDGYFDCLEGVTIDSQNGLIIFPEVEPFGADLAKKFNPGETSLISQYVYQPLYDSTQTVAQQFYPNLNRVCYPGDLYLAGRLGIPVECPLIFRRVQ